MDKKRKIDFISDPKDVKYKNIKTTLFNSRGEECDDSEVYFAKIDAHDKKNLYYIATSSGSIVDPLDQTDWRRKRLNFIFKKVSEQCFKSYIKYLSSYRRSFFNQVLRSQNG